MLFLLAPELFAYMLNFVLFFERLLSPYFFQELIKFLDLTFKVLPIFHHLAKFNGDRSRELGDLAPKCKKKQLLPSPFLGWGISPKFWDLHCLSNTLPIMCQNFRAVGRNSSEILRCKVPVKRTETSAVEHKTATAS